VFCSACFPGSAKTIELVWLNPLFSLGWSTASRSQDELYEGRSHF
jgi:hypothetical protein